MVAPLDLESLRARTIVASDPERTRAKVLARLAVRRRLARAGMALATLCALGVVGTLARSSSDRGPMPAESSSFVAAAPVVSAPREAPRSTVAYLTDATEVASVSQNGMKLVRGSARFSVVHDAQAPFRVVAGDFVVEDVGTVFVVSLDDAGKVDVSVEEGRVSVTGDGRMRVLEAGQSASFVKTLKPVVSQSGTASPKRPPSPDELLAAADQARDRGDSERATSELSRLLEAYPDDPRAELAAFTLGRVLADELRRPREAASAFERAASKRGPLAEDAWARAAEAWSSAGDRERASIAAQRYLAAYPDGRSAAAMRRLAPP